MNNRPLRIPSLDGIRAASFMAVFASHAGAAPEAIGNLGVNVFFFLSGYLITTLFRNEIAKTGAVDIRAFWIRRALRVLPPLFIVGLLSTILTLAIYPRDTFYGPTLTSELLLYFNYFSLYGIHRGNPGFGVTWSLAVEEHFYLLYPLLFVIGQKWLPSNRTRAAWLLGMSASVLLWRCVLVFGLSQTISRIYPATDTRIDSILYGCVLGLWHNPYLDFPLGRHQATRPDPIGISLLSMTAVFLAWCVLSKSSAFDFTFGFTGEGLALMLVFTAAIRFPNSLPFRFLNSRLAIFVGTLSYSLYLVHDVLIHAAVQLWPHSHAWERAVGSLIASFAFSYLIYISIERRCKELRIITSKNLPRATPRCQPGSTEIAQQEVPPMPGTNRLVGGCKRIHNSESHLL